MARDLPLLIVNPKSGKGTTEKDWASIANSIRSHFGPFDVAFTKQQHDGIAIAEEEARSGRKLLVAVGGDGTISEVANGILRSGSGAELGLLPRGTGSDFCRTLKIPLDLPNAAEKLKNSRARKMDVGKISFMNHAGHEDNRYFVNTASFGLSGRVAGKVGESSKRFGGTVAYASATLQSVFQYDRPNVSIAYDDHTPVRVRILTVVIANGPSFGGGMRIAPDAKLNDGLFDIITIGDLKTMQILMNTHKLYTGAVLSVDKVAWKQAKKLQAWPVESDVEVRLEIDGEAPGRLPASFEIQPGALSVRS